MEKTNKIQKPLESLQKILCGSYSDEQIFQALQILEKICAKYQNLGANPTEDKFKTVKSTNATLKQKLFAIKEIAEVLIGLGFVLQDDVYHYTGNDFPSLTTFSQIVHAQVEDIAERHLSSNEKADREKKKYLEERQKQIDLEYKKKHEEEMKIQQQLDADKKERTQWEHAKASVAHDLKFGTKTTKFADIGVDLCAQKGG